MSPWDVYDIMDFFKGAYVKFQTKREEHRERRFAEKEEERLQAELEAAQKRRNWPRLTMGLMLLLI